MRSSYNWENVELLLKDITGLVEPLPAEVRERRIQSGTHYCEMLPLEYRPSAEYMRAYQDALKNYAGATARAVGALAEKLYGKKGGSRAREEPAGPGGPEIAREISLRYGVEDINLIKPGIGEATRVLLRRVPWKIIVNEEFARSDALAHIYQLADEKKVPCEISKVRLGNYKACGIIKRLSDV